MNNDDVAYLKCRIVDNLFQPSSQPLWTELLKGSLNGLQHDLKHKICQMEKTLNEMKAVDEEVAAYLKVTAAEEDAPKSTRKKPRMCVENSSYERPVKRGRKGEDEAEPTNVKPVGPESPSYSPNPEIPWNWMADAGAPVKKRR
jgi:hypothetical protein